MRLVASMQDEDLLTVFKETGVKDVIIAPEKLARFGKNTRQEVEKLAVAAQKNDLRPILLWDILMNENAFKRAVDYLNSFALKIFYAIRLQDPGAFYYIKKNYPQLKIQLILERGNHNMNALYSWYKAGGKSLDRLIVPLEFDQEILARLLKNIPVSVELLGLGRILLYHSPRKLLASEFQERKEDFLYGKGSSEEVPHKGFTFLENQHGTFMFYPKDYCLLEYVKELKQMGVEFLRLDIPAKNRELYFIIADLLDNFSEESIVAIKKKHEREVIRGFYGANRSDSLFSKLKNPHIRPTEDFLGEVVEVKKKDYLALILKNKQYSLCLGDILLFKTPDGKEKKVEVLNLQDSSGQEISQASAGDLVLMPPVGGISIKTAVFLSSKKN